MKTTTDIKTWAAYINNAGGVEIFWKNHTGKPDMLHTYDEEKRAALLIYFLRNGIDAAFLEENFRGVAANSEALTQLWELDKPTQEEITELWERYKLGNGQSELFAGNNIELDACTLSEEANQILKMSDELTAMSQFERLDFMLGRGIAYDILNDLISDKLDEDNPEGDAEKLWHEYLERYSGDGANQLITDELLAQYA